MSTRTRYLQGLHFLEGGETPSTRAELAVAKHTLDVLRGAVIGAGSNTWRSAKDRYEVARKRFRAFDVPCEVTLHHVAERCHNLGPHGACEACEETVKTVMHRTLQRYGIELG